MSNEPISIECIPAPERKDMSPQEEIPVLPIRNAVLFPGSVGPFDVGRERSVALVEELDALSSPLIALFSQKDPSVDDPAQEDLHPMGCTARVLKIFKHSSGNYSLILQGMHRVHLEEVTQTTPYLKASVLRPVEVTTEDEESMALSLSLRDIAKQVMQLSEDLPREVIPLLQATENSSALTDLVAANLDISVEEKVGLLDSLDVKARMRSVLRFLTRQLEVLQMRDRINSQIKEEIGKNHREYVLRQQLKAIKEELGDSEIEPEDLEALEEKITQASLPAEAAQTARKQLKRLRHMPVGSAEYTVIHTYLDWLLDIPWTHTTEDNLDIAQVRNVLDSDHYGLEKIKTRILEYLSVRKLKKDKKGPILCLMGPPGVGKTSLGRSIARALGRTFHRISLGGVHDEAAIRGHRRTYVGSLPGQVIQGLKKAKTMNPVFMLDEVDKLGHDFRGDPAAALLEVLDPEQNCAFVDHYLEIPYDLSNVMFVATANISDSIPAPLRDRMEILEIPGYTRREKFSIARQHLLPKQLEEHGLTQEHLTLSNAVLSSIVENYTREAGVRTLERQIASVLRGVAVKVAEGDTDLHALETEEDIRPFLGPHRYTSDIAERTEEPGVATGLAWTSVGGEILFVEATRMFGTGKLQLTGQLGEVMRESAQAALSFVRTNAEKYGIARDSFEKQDIHIHLPAGAMPKDGPSAGVTLFSALVSIMTGVRVRHDVAMTGEITLRGRVLPVGGLKEKILAAHRAGIKRVILPERNRADLEEVPAEVLSELEVLFVSRMEQVLDAALEERLFCKHLEHKTESSASSSVN